MAQLEQYLFNLSYNSQTNDHFYIICNCNEKLQKNQSFLLAFYIPVLLNNTQSIVTTYKALWWALWGVNSTSYCIAANENFTVYADYAKYSSGEKYDNALQVIDLLNFCNEKMDTFCFQQTQKNINSVTSFLSFPSEKSILSDIGITFNT